MKKSLKEAQKRYSEKCYTFCLRFNKEKDRDILAWVKEQSNINGCIKELIRSKINSK